MKKINLFELVYVAIAIATFSHTTWAAATVFDGPSPAYQMGLEGQSFIETLIMNYAYYRWFFDGALIAIAIDIGMLVAAKELSKKWNWLVLFAFMVASLASFYTQVMYSLHHTGEFTYGGGVTPGWMNILEPIVDARVVLIPLMLPLFAIIYTFARISQEKLLEADEQLKRTESEPKSWTFVHRKRIYGPYPTELERDLAYEDLMEKVVKRAEKKGKQPSALPVKGEDYTLPDGQSSPSHLLESGSEAA